jgi:hypothetical protein
LCRQIARAPKSCLIAHKIAIAVGVEETREKKVTQTQVTRLLCLRVTLKECVSALVEANARIGGALSSFAGKRVRKLA